MDRDRDFKRIHSSSFYRCREETARSHAYKIRLKLEHHMNMGQKILCESHWQDLSRSQKLQQRRFGPFIVTKRIIRSTHQVQDTRDPSNVSTVHRNLYIVVYYP